MGKRVYNRPKYHLMYAQLEYEMMLSAMYRSDDLLITVIHTCFDCLPCVSCNYSFHEIKQFSQFSPAMARSFEAMTSSRLKAGSIGVGQGESIKDLGQR